MTVALTLPLLGAVGLAVDVGRYLHAQGHMQDVADAASLALAAGSVEGKDKIWARANDVISANFDAQMLDSIDIGDIMTSGDSYDVRLSGRMKTTFMALAGFDTLDVKASSLAIRGVNGSVEVALVLDNTWSMSDDDGKGVVKISALKSSAKDLIGKLLGDGKSAVTISVVPYADYVNVGAANRSAGWLNVPADEVTVNKGKCSTPTETRKCVGGYSPKTYCERLVDGVAETYQCGGNECLEWKVTPIANPKTTCSPDTTTTKTFFGCIGSRMAGKTRLDDKTPSERYPGFIDTVIRCPTPILPLTKDKSTLLSSIDNLIVNRGTYYRPLTYIPTGMMWGINVLSPDAPFSEGKAYDSANVKPRKVIVLMTDGENTLRFVSSNGTHKAPAGTETQKATQMKQTREDTLALCDYAKANKIEVFTVAFGVDSTEAKTLLESCASDASHYYDAADSTALADSFSKIVTALQQVRIAR